MNKLRFLRLCFWIGAAVDLFAVVPLLSPDIAKLVFGLPVAPNDDAYMYVSRIGASLMLGWTLLFAWGSQKPIERKEIILLTVVPVLLGLLGASILAVTSGFVQASSMLPLWILYAVLIPLFLIGYLKAAGTENDPRVS